MEILRREDDLLKVGDLTLSSEMTDEQRVEFHNKYPMFAEIFLLPLPPKKKDEPPSPIETPPLLPLVVRIPEKPQTFLKGVLNLFSSIFDPETRETTVPKSIELSPITPRLRTDLLPISPISPILLPSTLPTSLELVPREDPMKKNVYTINEESVNYIFKMYQMFQHYDQMKEIIHRFLDQLNPQKRGKPSLPLLIQTTSDEIDLLNKKNRKFERERDELNRKNVQLESHLQAAGQKNKKLKEQLLSAQEALERAQSLNVSITTEKDSALSRALDQNKVLEYELSRLKAENDEFASVKEENVNLQALHETITKELDDVKKAFSLVNNQNETLTTQLQDATASNSAQLAEIEAKHRLELFQLHEAHKSDMDQLKAEIETLRETITLLQSNVHEARKSNNSGQATSQIFNAVGSLLALGDAIDPTSSVQVLNLVQPLLLGAPEPKIIASEDSEDSDQKLVVHGSFQQQILASFVDVANQRKNLFLNNVNECLVHLHRFNWNDEFKRWASTHSEDVKQLVVRVEQFKRLRGNNDSTKSIPEYEYIKHIASALNFAFISHNAQTQEINELKQKLLQYTAKVGSLEDFDRVQETLQSNKYLVVPDKKTEWSNLFKETKLKAPRGPAVSENEVKTVEQEVNKLMNPGFFKSEQSICSLDAKNNFLTNIQLCFNQMQAKFEEWETYTEQVLRLGFGYACRYYMMLLKEKNTDTIELKTLQEKLSNLQVLFDQQKAIVERQEERIKTLDSQQTSSWKEKDELKREIERLNNQIKVFEEMKAQFERYQQEIKEILSKNETDVQQLNKENKKAMQQALSLQQTRFEEAMDLIKKEKEEALSKVQETTATLQVRIETFRMMSDNKKIQFGKLREHFKKILHEKKELIDLKDDQIRSLQTQLDNLKQMPIKDDGSLTSQTLQTAQRKALEEQIITIQKELALKTEINKTLERENANTRVEKDKHLHNYERADKKYRECKSDVETEKQNKDICKGDLEKTKQTAETRLKHLTEFAKLVQTVLRVIISNEFLLPDVQKQADALFTAELTSDFAVDAFFSIYKQFGESVALTSHIESFASLFVYLNKWKDEFKKQNHFDIHNIYTSLQYWTYFKLMSKISSTQFKQINTDIVNVFSEIQSNQELFDEKMESTATNFVRYSSKGILDAWKNANKEKKGFLSSFLFKP